MTPSRNVNLRENTHRFDTIIPSPDRRNLSLNGRDPSRYLSTDNLQRPYLSTRLAAAQFPEKTKSQRGYPRFLGEGGQGRGDEGQDQGKRRPGALAVGAVREERQQGEEAGEEVGATDHAGHRLAVDRMRREQEAGDRVAQAVPSRQYLENATNPR